jgi:hypothetical protein
MGALMSNTYIATPQSKHIEGYEYDPEKKILRITFKRNRHQYDYYDVPNSTIQGLEAALSKSAYFNINIKPKYRVVRVR